MELDKPMTILDKLQVPSFLVAVGFIGYVMGWLGMSFAWFFGMIYGIAAIFKRRLGRYKTSLNAEILRNASRQKVSNEY